MAAFDKFLAFTAHALQAELDDDQRDCALHSAGYLFDFPHAFSRHPEFLDSLIPLDLLFRRQWGIAGPMSDYDRIWLWLPRRALCLNFRRGFDVVAASQHADAGGMMNFDNLG